MPINQTIVGKIYTELKEKIINQQIKLNQRISIKEIAEDSVGLCRNEIV